MVVNDDSKDPKDWSKEKLLATFQKQKFDDLLKEARINPNKDREEMHTVSDTKSIDKQFRVMKGLAKIPLSKKEVEDEL